MFLLARALLVALTVAGPLGAAAQPAAIPRIGVLSLDSPAESVCVDRLRRGLADLGYVEGKNYAFEPRWAKDRLDLLPVLAAELVRAH